MTQAFIIALPFTFTMLQVAFGLTAIKIMARRKT